MGEGRGRISRPNQDATRQCRSRLPLGLRAFAAGESRRGQDRVGALQPLAVGYAGNAIFFGQGCGARGGRRGPRKGPDAAAADKAWTRLLAIEKQSSLAAQTHFALAGLYRKQGKTAEAERETQEFQKLQNPATQPESLQK